MREKVYGKFEESGGDPRALGVLRFEVGAERVEGVRALMRRAGVGALNATRTNPSMSLRPTGAPEADRRISTRLCGSLMSWCRRCMRRLWAATLSTCEVL